MRLTEREFQALKAKNPQIKEKVERVYRTPVLREFIPIVGDEKAILEDAIQSAFFSWVLHADNRALMPKLDLVYAIPNGSNKSKTQRGLFQATGLRSGVPDIHIAHSKKPFFSFYIEVKRWKEFNTKNHGCSDSQLAWHERLRNAGHRVEVLWSVSKMIRETREYLGYVK